MKTLVIIFFGMSLILSGVAGCSAGDSGSKIIGQWQRIEEPSMPGSLSKVEFFNDNTYTVNFRNVNSGAAGKWTILEDGRIKLHFDFGDMLFASIKGDTLLVKSFDGVATLKKIK